MARRRRRSTPPSSILFILLFLLCGGAFGQPPPPPSSPPQQRLSSRADFRALLSLRATLGLRSRDWPLKAEPCTSWAGVQCDGSGRVVGLTLAGHRRTRLGSQNPRFAVDGLRNLTLLRSFNASGFPLPGNFPGWFSVPGAVPSGLFVLDLSGASVSGAVPAALGALRTLSILRLPGNRLDGDVPVALGNATGLTVLDLARNGLTGPVPSSFASLTSLIDLDLSSNRLSGPIPSGLGSLRSLQSLSLAGNFLNGTIPASILALSGLRLLDLASNNLTGELLFNSTPAPFDGLTGNLVLDISSNTLYGELPPGAFRKVRTAVISENYFQGAPPQGNVSVTGNCFRGAANQRTEEDCRRFYAQKGLVFVGFSPPASPSPSLEPVPAVPRSKKKSYILVPSIVGGAVLAFVCAALVALCLKRRSSRDGEAAVTAVGSVQSRRKKETAPRASNAGGSRGRAVPVSAEPVNLAAVGDSFTYEQLHQATSGFGDANLIKRGHSGDLYHGTLDSGTRIVVKRIDLSGGGAAAARKEAGYMVEMDLFGRASHARIVPVLGYSLAKEEEKLLVYKYMPNGDLASSLYRKKVGNEEDEDSLISLDWITRLKIAIGIAEALSYLHHECTPPIVHRDIQASSILLDDKFEVRLGSLSEVSIQEGDGSQNVISRMLRKSAEPSTSGSSSPSTCAHDVYCLGKILLELVTGRLGISGSSDATSGEMLDQILPYVNITDKELLTKVIDPSLILDEDFMEEVLAMAIVAKRCLHPRPTKRPLVRYVLKALENPLKVVREESISNSARMRGSMGTSSRSWNAALGSWRSTSEAGSGVVPPRDLAAGLKRSETIDSKGSGGGEHSFNNHRKTTREIFPEPAGGGGSHDIMEV